MCAAQGVFCLRRESAAASTSCFSPNLTNHTRQQDIEQLIEPLLHGRSAGVISEAGVPGVADPGAAVAALAHDRGIRVVPLVGPSSILLSLMASGQNGQSFAFVGYLPVKPAERARALRALEKRAFAEGQSQIFIEAPYRNIKLLEQILSVCSPQTILTVATDITSEGEFIRSRSIALWRTGAACGYRTKTDHIHIGQP